MLFIDSREACGGRPTGKGAWSRALVQELLRRSVPLTLLLERGEPLPSWAQGATVRYFPAGPLWHFAVARFLRLSAPRSIYFSPTSYITLALLPRRVRSVIVVHDLIAFRSEPHAWKPRFLERLFLPLALRRARLVCTVSRATEQDLCRHFPAINASLACIFAGPSLLQAQSNISDGKTVLCIATLCPRKNQERLVRAFAALPSSVRSRSRLVLAGSRGWNDASILRAAEETSGVEWKQYIDDIEYADLLASCAVFALPSLYEGSGLAVLDALRAGAAVLTSDRGSLKEVAGDAAEYCDPEDIASIARGLERLLTDTGRADDLRRRGPRQAAKYTWEKTADLLLEALQTMKK